MTEKSWKLPCLILFGALLACGTPSPETLLDEVCRDQQCATSGSARETTGLTTDSIGFELGPGPGSVNIMVPAWSNRLGAGIELQMRGSGQVLVTIEAEDCAPTCSSSSIELRQNWVWVSGGLIPTTPFSGTSDAFTLVVETRDQTSTARLVDMRFR